MQYNNSTTISLISHIHSLTADFLTEKLSAKGLPNLASSHGFILFQLSNTDKMPMSEIAKRINRDKSTTTVLIKKLKKLNLVEEEESKNDKRVKYIKLSEKGKEYTESTKTLSEELLKKCFAGFSEEDKNKLTELLNKIANNFD